MKNILENKFWWAAKSFAAVAVLGVSVATADGVFFTEITDPQNSSDAGRFVEIYNSSSGDIDLSAAGYKIQRWTNANADPTSSSIIDLTGTIPAGGFYIICNDADKFLATYGFDADQDIGTGGAADSNGDDNIALVDASGAIVDMFGVGGEDGTGTAHEFEDGRAERVATVTSGNPTWDAAEWNIDNDSGGGDGPQYAPEDFDPGAWIGLDGGQDPSIVGTWKLAPLPGALSVGDQGPGSGNWWSSSAGDVDTRACLFDDEYVFGADGSFNNVMGTETWLETWQGVDSEQCGTPVAPHDGSTTGSYYADAFGENGYIAIVGAGSFLGLAKAVNGGELSGGASLPDSVVYSVVDIDEDEMLVSVWIGGNGYWTFHMVNSQWEPTYEDINITFNLDMNNAESINSEGISIAGGNLFGVPGENQMTDDDGDGIYTTTLTVPANSGSDYTFINGISDWGQKENIAGQECAVDPYNDRTLEWGEEDIVVNACFGLCGDGTCADLTLPPTVLVHFNVYAPDGPDTVWATGSFEGWSGYGVALTDPDGNDIYTGTQELIEYFGDVEYKYTHGGWDIETGATTGDWCDWYPDDAWNNFGFSVEEYDVYLPIFVWGQGCEQWLSPMAGNPWMIANEPGAIGVGPSMGSGEWWSNDEAALSDRACYFDDRYIFTWNGEFYNEFGGNTWVEEWQDGTADGCRAPVAPHDNSNPASYSFDADAGTVTLHGVGAFLGLPKAVNGAELTSPADAPGSVTYVLDQFDEDSAMVYIDISANQDGSSWWSYFMVREPGPTMVTFWLDAYGVPCDGNPYVAGSFNGWNATDIEMTYDEYYDEYWADVFLMPGYYEYKFVCFDWSASENIPAECSDPFDDGYNNRYVEVPQLDEDDWYEVDIVGWGQCPDPDPCDLLDCANLHFVGIMESGLVNHISAELGFTADSIMSLVSMGQVLMGVGASWDADTDTATFMPEFSSVEDTQFVYLSEYPYGIPDTTVYYFWWWSVPAYSLEGSEFFDLQEYGPGEECTFAIEDYDEYNNTTLVFNVRYWDPYDWQEELYLLAIGDEDVDPYDIWNADLYGSCEYFGVDDTPDFATYLGDFNGHEYYAVGWDMAMNWEDANDSAIAWEGHLATITSPEENEFLRSSLDYAGIYDEHYIGLYDQNMDGTGWSWVTGEPLWFTNWADGEPNGPGYENVGEFWNNGKWNDITGMDPKPFIVEVGGAPEEPTITSYTYQVQTLDSYYNGDYATTVLPQVDVNDGLHTIATFDTAGIEGPYAGIYVLFYDLNFNGQLDSTDFNVLNWSEFGNDDNVLLLVDNGPNDMNPEVGVYETITYADSPEGGFLRSQGANFFMVALSPDYTISGYTAVSPVSGSTNRVTGTGTMPDPDTGELVGVPNMFVYIGDWDYGDYIGMGITGPDGSYDIGVDINDYTEVVMWVVENYDITNRYVGVFENGGYGGYGGTWIQATLGPDGTVQDFDVIKLNTLVHGQVTAPDGSPVAGAYIDIEWNYAGDYYGYYNSSLWHYTDTDEYGNYSFWGMNGESVNISVQDPGYNYPQYYEEVNIFSETYDEYIDGYYFNHNIMLMDQPPLPQTQLLVNNSFEYYNQDNYSWNNYADDWWSWPTSHNTHIELTGAGIGWDGAVFTAYDNYASLKMWGQYNGDGADNTTDYYQTFHDHIEPGAVIHASAMMMSHPDDWIGGGSGLNNGQVFVSYFDDYWNFMGTDLSDPVDSSDTAGEWHYRSVIGEVPDGAANVNIGVRYNQVHGSDGSEGHGAIFYDMAQAYTSASDVHTVQIYGMTEQDDYDENGEYMGTAPLPNATIYVWNENYFIEVMSDDYGWWFADVPADQWYYVTGGYLEGFYESSFEEVYACDDYYYYYYNYDYYDYYDYCDNQVNVNFMPNSAMWFEVQGQVTDGSGNPMYNAQVIFDRADSSDFRRYFSYTDYMGYFQDNVPHGTYNVHVGMTGFMVYWNNGVEVTQHGVFLDISLEPAEFTGAVEGVVVLHGNPPEGQIHLNFWNAEYDAMGTTNENGFFNIPLVDGVYGAFANAPGYSAFYQGDAFEIAGNTVTFNIELYEHGFAGAPQIVDLHDIPNDQGRQMRSVWNPGIPGDWGYFTQYSIWRKVNGAPIELWDYVETVPWHGMDDPYAAVLPTLGDSSMHGTHLSTFMVTAHTEDIDIWFDSQPASGYSIDNLHPGAPMSLMYTHSGGTVSLNWSGPEDVDFSYHNIYRQDITSSDPAIVFTTVDSFYVDQDVTDAGAYEYWVTAVDLSGLESEPSNSVSAVLSADENLGLPTEFALKQNYPNPFNPSTQIQYALPEETRVTISIYDLMGRKVRTLVNDVQDAGYRTVMWNATNDMGRLVSAGLYIYSIRAGDFIQNRKMVLMK